MATYRSEAWKKAISESKIMREWRQQKLAYLKEAFAWGANDKDACIHAGINVKTLWRWEQRYPEISQELQAARESLVLSAYALHAKAVKNDPAYARDYLRVRRPEEFKAQVHKVELSGGLKSETETTPQAAERIAAAVGAELKRLNEEANKKA